MPPADELRGRGFDLQFGVSAKGRWAKAVRRPPSDGAPFVNWLSSERGGNTLVIEGSLSNLWLRTTGQELEEESIVPALNELAAHVERITDVPFDARRARVLRTDFFRDFDVGEENVKPFLDAASQASPPRLERIRWTDSTLYYRSKARGREITLYSKFAEATSNRRKFKGDSGRWRGILRLEARFRSSRSCSRLARRLQVPDNSAGELLTGRVWEVAMSDALRALNLDSPTPTHDERIRLLLEQCPADAAELLGLLIYRELLGDDCGQAFGWSPSTFRRKRRRLITLGLWSSTSTPRQLPGLHLVKPMQLAKSA
jgi:hypothetical protein